METRRYVRDVSKYGFVPMDQPNWEDLSEDEWVRVEGGGLSAPIYVRVIKTNDGGVAINGLVMGAAWPRSEVTANELRQVRPRDILNQLFADFDPNSPPDYDDWEDSITWGLMHEVYMMRLPTVPVESSAARSAGTPDKLEEFARIYLREFKLRPKKAMTATAEAMNISRATANRWAARARDRGLLPQRSPRERGE